MRFLFLLSLLIIFTGEVKAQDCPHFFKVLNVYRRDKSAIDDYAKEFVTNNQGLFLYKLAYLANTDIEAPKNFVPYVVSDSGIIANAIFVHKSDTIYATIGLLSKNNRTQIILLSAKNYRNESLIRDFIKNRIDDIIAKYHKFLKEKNADTKNW